MPFPPAPLSPSWEEGQENGESDEPALSLQHLTSELTCMLGGGGGGALTMVASITVFAE